MHILQGKCVEKQIITLPEDLDQMAEKVLKMGFDLWLLLFVDEGVNSFTSAEAIRPLFHFKGLLQLEVAQLEKLYHVIIVSQANRPWNLVGTLVLGFVSHHNL